MSYVPKVHYISDHADLTFPSYHMGRCDKIMSEGSVRRDVLTGEGYCRKPGKAAIFWTYPNGLDYRTRIINYYCVDHLDDEMRRVFKGGVVTAVQLDGSEKKMSLTQLLAERAEVK